MESNPIGANIRRLRTARSWTQAQLAGAAQISERTVQRAERGEALSAENLQALAGALAVEVDDLRRPWQDPEMQRLAEEAKRRFELVPLKVIARPSELTDFFPNDALVFERDGLTNDEQEDAAAELIQDIRDVGDIWGDLEPVQRREATKTLQPALDRIKELGLSVSAGAYTTKLRARNGGPGISFELLVVIVSPATEPKLAFMRDRQARVRFV